MLAAALAVMLTGQAPRSTLALEGTWTGTASRRPDSGPPATVRLRISGVVKDSVRVYVTLAESRQIDLAIPSPYSDSAHAILRGDSLHVEFSPDIGLGFIGRLVPSDSERIVISGRVRGDSITGTLRITRFQSPIVLTKGVRANAALVEQDVTFKSTADGLRLGGTLILPRGRGPFPAAVFVTGSDPDTRDAWRLEAEALARRGIAALVYDKRGIGESRGANHDLASWDDLTGDLEGGVALLRTKGDVIDARRIGVIGQSQGTWIIAKAAARDPRIAFVVSISGSGMSGAEQETYRTGALMGVAGFSRADIDRARTFQREKFAVARTGLGWERFDSTMQRLRSDSVKWFPGYGTGAAARTLALLRLYGVLQFNYDPRRDLSRISAPALVIMGADDVVFPPDTVVKRMGDALAAGGNRRLTTHVLPATTHGMMILQSIDGKPFRRVISPRFVELLSGWIAKTTQARRGVPLTNASAR